MPRPPGSSDPDLWTLDLPPSQDTSVGYMVGARIHEDGSVEQGRENEDRYFTCKLEGVQLYMVLDGHHGSRACEFAQKHIPSLLLRYHMGDSGEKAAEALKFAFENTEKHFFMMLDPSITRKMGLQLEIQEKGGTTSMLAYSMFPDKVEELQRLEEQIKGGTTAVVALILNNRQLWVANVGDSRAVLCYLDGSDRLHTEQISEDHNTRNQKELARLVECGLDEMRLRNSGRLGMHQNTRSIGDYTIKGGYKDHDILSTATREPGTAEPFISHPPLDITTIRGFLLLMSDGLYDAHSSVTNSSHTVNHDIAVLVQRQMDLTHDVMEVAQRVVEQVKSNFHVMLQQDKRSARLDDITLVIRNLRYPMGKLAGPTATAPPNLQNPFNFSQSQQQSTAKKVHYENSGFHQQQSMVERQLQYNQTTAGGYTPTHHSHTQTHQPLTNRLPSQHNQHTTPYARQPQVQPSPHTQYHMPPDPYSTSPLALKKSESDSRVNQQLPGTRGAPELQHTGYGQQHHHQYHTNSAQPDSRQNHPGGSYQTSAYPSSPSIGHSFYENWEVSKKKADRSHDQTHPGTAAVGEMTGKLSKLGVGSSVLPPRPGSREPTPAASSVPTNAELQYQTSQQVLPPPVTSQPPASQHLTPNSVLSRPSAIDATSVASSNILRRGSTLDDESWMYNHDQEAVDASTPMNQPQPNISPQEVSQIPEQTGGRVVGNVGNMVGESVTGEMRIVVGESVTGEMRIVGEVVGSGAETEVVELEMPSDREDPSDMEEDEEEDGMIKPIIRFDKFPPDLSWDQI